jgi:hypothetical protein
MAKTFQKLTRPAMRKLSPGKKIAEHGITFERLANGDAVFTVNIMVSRGSGYIVSSDVSRMGRHVRKRKNLSRRHGGMRVRAG